MIDTRKIVTRLSTIESLAVIPRVSSTNLIARRVVTECIDNELSLPQAMIVAGEQYAGRGRNDRTWTSPAGKGIYATTMLTRSVAELPLFPLQMANLIADYLLETFGIEAQVKWPNDVLAGGRKIAGILIEARIQESRAFLIIGTGVNVEPVPGDERLNAAAITELSPRNYSGLEAATIAFIEHVDRGVARKFRRDQVLDEWRRRTIHRQGDPITCVVGDRTFTGTWKGIDDEGRAILRRGDETTVISAGDIII